MTDAFMGEIRNFGFNFAPNGWFQCNGQLLPIAQYSALFSLLGTMYGGNGTTNFGLPDLRGRVAISVGQGGGLSSYDQGEVGGTEQVSLTGAQVGPHTHPVSASSSASTKSPSNALPAVNASGSSYGTSADLAMSPTMVGPNNGGQPHENRQPFLVTNFCICSNGIYPSRG